MKANVTETTRFDARLPKEQKALFEKAASLGGYRNLTDFIIITVQQKAAEIIQEKERIIASEQDALIFFKGITEPAEPNKALKETFKEYNKYLANINNENDNNALRPSKRQK